MQITTCFPYPCSPTFNLVGGIALTSLVGAYKGLHAYRIIRQEEKEGALFCALASLSVFCLSTHYLISNWSQFPLQSCIDGEITGGMIIETEAYNGPSDRASHAYQNKRTPRNESMFKEGGCAYIFHCYGLHVLFNVVTNQKEIPHAVLIRAIQPEIGLSIMEQRRNHKKPLSLGPGTLTQALSIQKKLDGTSLIEGPIWLEDRGIFPKKIEALPRVGIDYAGEDAKLPWRFRFIL